MYLFDPTPLQIALAGVAMVSAGFLAAWLVTAGDGSRTASSGAGGGGAAEEDGELATRKKAILWTAAAGAAIFLLWWATLSTGSGRTGL